MFQWHKCCSRKSRWWFSEQSQSSVKYLACVLKDNQSCGGYYRYYVHALSTFLGKYVQQHIHAIIQLANHVVATLWLLCKRNCISEIKTTDFFFIILMFILNLHGLMTALLNLSKFSLLTSPVIHRQMLSDTIMYKCIFNRTFNFCH